MNSDLSPWLVVIPARLGSQRLPRKPLLQINGRPLIRWVWDNLAPLAEAGATLVVATDSEEVATVCNQEQISVTLTRDDHPSGSDRCNEVAARYALPFILNVQGDEPFVRCFDLFQLMAILAASTDSEIATLAYRSTNKALISNPNVVKIVTDCQRYARYFSRLPIPYWRDFPANANSNEHWLHLGVYAFRRESLENFCALPVSPLEAAEKLEQLRALENNLRIIVVEASHFSCGIDTPEDLARAEKIL